MKVLKRKKKEGEFKEREANTNLISPCDRKFQMFVQTSSQFLTRFYQQCIEYEDWGQARAWGLTISLFTSILCVDPLGLAHTHTSNIFYLSTYISS